MLVSKDYLVTGELFEVWECGSCRVRFTQDVPTPDRITGYYKSENYISHSDIRKGIINRLYHTARAITLKSKRNVVKSVTHLSVGNLLDIGAGTGAFVHHMQRQGWGVVGIEPNAEARKHGSSVYGVKLQEPSQLFHLHHKTFDAITLWHVIEHVHEVHDYLDQIKKLLADDGKLLVGVPNYQSFDAGNYQEKWAAYDVPRHLYHFCPAAMKKLLSLHSLEVETVRPMWFDSFYVSLLTEQYQQRSGAFLRGMLKGLISNGKALVNPENASSLIYVASKTKEI